MLPPALLTLALPLARQVLGSSPVSLATHSAGVLLLEKEKPWLRHKSESRSEIHTQPRSCFSSKRAKVLSECLRLSWLVQRNKSHNPQRGLSVQVKAFSFTLLRIPPYWRMNTRRDQTHLRMLQRLLRSLYYCLRKLLIIKSRLCPICFLKSSMNMTLTNPTRTIQFLRKLLRS